MSTMIVYDGMTMTVEDCENAPRSAIPIIPGGMVDVALSEFGASIVDVCIDETQSPSVFHESAKPTATS